MSVNIYGNRLLSGKAGKDGKDGGLNLVHFIPDKIKSWFRKAEEIWLYFDTEKGAIIFDKDKKTNWLAQLWSWARRNVWWYKFSRNQGTHQ